MINDSLSPPVDRRVHLSALLLQLRQREHHDRPLHLPRGGRPFFLGGGRVKHQHLLGGCQRSVHLSYDIHIIS